jgi:hypothetical protein
MSIVARTAAGFFLCFTVPACSRCARTPPSEEIAQASPSEARPAKCDYPGDDAQPVKFDIDLEYIATHGAGDVLDPMWWTGDIYGSVTDYEHCLRGFSRQQRILYALLWYRSEVSNGGHHQFFFNSTGIVWPDALAALEELKLGEAVAILTEANRRMGGTPSRDRDKRQEQLERSNPEFDDLDKRLYALDDKVNIDSIMTKYIRANPKAFVFKGVVRIPKSTLKLRERVEKLLDAAAPSASVAP